jgi:hypothetical protein
MRSHVFQLHGVHGPTEECVPPFLNHPWKALPVLRKRLRLQPTALIHRFDERRWVHYSRIQLIRQYTEPRLQRRPTHNFLCLHILPNLKRQPMFLSSQQLADERLRTWWDCVYRIRCVEDVVAVDVTSRLHVIHSCVP